MKAVGIHVFAGGFTMGVQKVFEVDTHLETHGFGLETAQALCGVNCINEENADWPHIDAEFAYGNPRCTGFSCITSGYGEDVHGPFSKQCKDIHQFCDYVAGRYDIAIWESVQQAYTTGRPLLDLLRDEIFVPRHYRIAHVFVNASSFGNPQRRKRYFFVAYRNDRNFNIVPPDIDPESPVMHDAIWHLRDRPTREAKVYDGDYDFDTYLKLTPPEKDVLPNLPNGWCINKLGRFAEHLLPHDYRQKWRYRTSDMPFSMHCVHRTSWLNASPTLHSSAGRFIHPSHHRPLTVGELATIMGWPDIPRGKIPIAQMAKGVVPAVGEWLAQQAAMYLNNEWGNDDWESSYDHNKGEWVGSHCPGKVEKVFDLTRYHGSKFERENYDLTGAMFYRLRVELNNPSAAYVESYYEPKR